MPIEPKRVRAPAVAARALRCVLGCISPGLGCQDDPEEPDARSEYVDLYLDDGVQICGGQLDAYDRFISLVFDTWTGAQPNEFRASLHSTTESLPDTPCGTGLSHQGGGCARSAGIWLNDDHVQYHELAHVVHAATDGWSAQAINEGVAETFGNTFPNAFEPEDLVQQQVSLAPLVGGPFEIGDYTPAGFFTRFLMERHGADAFRTYGRAMSLADARTTADFEREFEAAFGEAVDTAWADFTAARRCSYDFSFCGEHPPLPLPLSIDTISCDEPDSLGFDATAASFDDFQPSRIFTLEATTSLTLKVVVEYASVRVLRCGDCKEQRHVLYADSLGHPAGAPPIARTFDIEPGTHAVIVRMLPGGPFHVDMTVPE